MSEKTGLDRRQFIGIAWTAALLAFAVQAGSAFVKFMTPELEPGPVSQVSSPGLRGALGGRTWSV
jgi:hypothetical protein